MKNTNDVFPQDIQNEVLLRLPVKSVGKCICVSKKWAAIIREKYFRDRYFLQSKTRPRLLFVFVRRNDPNVLFHSVYQEKEPLLSSGLQQTRITLKPDSKVCPVLRGVVCIISDFKIIIFNPGTKKFLTSPELRDPDLTFMKAFLGYDEATDVLKVLCVTNKRVCYGTSYSYHDLRVFTVGSGEECWRTIDCEPLYSIATKGLCKDGFLYFGAWTRSNNDPIVISFNLRSEKLNLIELPKPIPSRLFSNNTVFGASLVNYNGEIALVNRLVYENGEIQILVRNEIAGDWRGERIVIPRWRETVRDLCKDFSLEGTIGAGKLVFALDKFNTEESMIVLYYDTITQHLTKFEIDGVASDTFDHVSSFLDHVDSLSLM